MSNTLTQAETETEKQEVEYGNHLIWKMVGAKITMFGANANGEIFLSVEKDGLQTQVVIGTDETGDIALFEIENKAKDNG